MNPARDKKVVVVGGGSVGLDVDRIFRTARRRVHHRRYASADRYARRPDHEMLHARDTRQVRCERVREHSAAGSQRKRIYREASGRHGRPIWSLTSDSTAWACARNNPLLPQLEEAFADTDTYIYTIGDSVRARRIMEGTMEGRAILNVLENRGYIDLAPLE